MVAASNSLSHLLATKRFLPLFITQSMAAFNDSLFRNTLIMLINYQLAINLHKNAATLSAMVSGIFILPFLLFSATGGELADKFSKSNLIRVIKVAEIIIIIIATIGLFQTNINLLFIALFLMGLHSAIFGPVKYAIIPELLDKHEILGGNSWFEASTFVVILLGTMASSLGFSLHYGMYIISLVFLSCAICALISGFMIPKTKAIEPNLQISWNFINKTFEVIYESRRNKKIFYSILTISWLWFMGIVLTTELPVLFTTLFNVTPSVVSTVIAVFSIGVAVGSLLCNKISKGIAKFNYTPWVMIGMSLFILDLCYSCYTRNLIPNSKPVDIVYMLNHQSGWRMFCDIFAAAICGGLYVLPFATVLQTESKDSYRSRIIASGNIINALFMVIASIMVITIIKIGFSVISVFIITAILNIIFAVWLLYKISIFKQ